MPWTWLIIMGIARLLLLLIPNAPFFNVKNEFVFEGSALTEAREFANAITCRSILGSFPAFMFLMVLSAANKAYPQGIDSVMICVYIFVFLVILIICFLISPKYFRGTMPPFYWLGGVIIIETLIRIFAFECLVDWLQP